MASDNSDPKKVASGKAVTDGACSITRVSKAIPLPCITILIHGVNDVGEAYDAQERGVCRGLNARLNRSHMLEPNSKPDLVPSRYRMPPKTDEEKKKESKEDKRAPDKVYYRRLPDADCWSPIVPFYWGSREEQTHIKNDNPSGQWTDRYGNRIDKDGAKNGGPFANATNELNSLWNKEGFESRIMNAHWIATMQSSPTHALLEACPRAYMIFAAKRLAMLIKMIRDKHPGTAINVLAHSQGTMVSLVAHALLKEEGGTYSADTLIFQDSPYSLEETYAEWKDQSVRDRQQTTQSRLKTLSNIVKYVYSKKAAAPSLADLQNPKIGDGVVGTFWKPGPGAQKLIELRPQQPYTFTERDNRGKVYCYFCPNDQTVSFRSVEGIGWQGVPDKIEAGALQKSRQQKLDEERIAQQQLEGLNGVYGQAPSHTPSPPSTEMLTALAELGGGFRQRVFTSRMLDGKPAILVGEAPRQYEMRKTMDHGFFGGIAQDIVPNDLVEPSTTGSPGKSNGVSGLGFLGRKQIPPGETRTINGEELVPPIRAVLSANEISPGYLRTSVVDAAIAVGSGGVETVAATVQDFRDPARWYNPLNNAEKQQLQQSIQSADYNPNDPNTQRQLVGNPWTIEALPLSPNSGFVGPAPHLRYQYSESPDEALERWRKEPDENSDHSSIPANPDHAAYVTAYDLSVGKPLPTSADDKESCFVQDVYMEYLRNFADWRTDWKLIGQARTPLNAKIMEYADGEQAAGAIALRQATYDYHTKGVLPQDIADSNGVATLPIPKAIVIQQLSDRMDGRPPQPQKSLT